MPTLEERLIAKVTSKPEEKQSAVSGTKDPINKPKALITHSQVSLTGKPQSYEDLCKALGIPVKKKD